MRTRTTMAAAALLIAGCASRPTPIAVAPMPEPTVAHAALPPGATPGMLVPQPLADGSFPTPNRGLFGAAAVWHLRAGLNVAALSCPGAEGAAIRAGYNGWLTRDKTALGKAQRLYAAGYPGGTDAYDEAMTRLYNFFSQTPVRNGLCSAAAAIVAEMGGVDAGALDEFAATRLATLDRPFTEFYAAYDAWRREAVASSPPAVIAAAAPAPVIAAAPVSRIAPSTLAAHNAVSRPTLTLDLSSLPADSAVTDSH